MARKIYGKSRAFTIVELMVGIFVTLAAIGTFFKLYTNSVKAQRVTNIRSSVMLVGDQMIDSIANSIRLIGLDNEYLDFNPGVGVPGSIILNSQGGTGTDTITFQYLSPFGGPIAQLAEDATDPGPCVFHVKKDSSTAFHTGLMTVNLLSASGVFTGTVITPITETTLPPDSEKAYRITTSALVNRGGFPFAGSCATTFPKGTLITGPNNNYTLRYVKNGSNVVLTLNNASTGQSIVNFVSNANSPYTIPFFVLQFQREYTDVSGTLRREWVSSINAAGSPVFLQDVKAVRVGFVVVSNINRTNKKVATAGLSTTMHYCPFENMCYDTNDVNKTAFVFRRVIYIKNFDYLQRASSI